VEVGAADSGDGDANAHFIVAGVGKGHPANRDGGAGLDEGFHGGHFGDLSIPIGWARRTDFQSVLFFSRREEDGLEIRPTSEGIMTPTVPAHWWQSLYDDIVAELFLVRKDQQELHATIAFLRQVLHLVPGDTAFDQGSGIGSLVLPLAREGIAVIGVDQASAYIERARAEAAKEALPCEFHAADATTFVPLRPCASGFNWGTSFGNADDESNRRMLRCAREAIRPGGWFALDYQNIPALLHRFKECMVRRHTDANGETVLLRESTVDLAGGVLVQRWTFFFPDGRSEVRHSAIRLYLPHVLADMLRECGFAEIEFHGGVRGEPLSLTSSRCILIARRP
jgi:hypothetical protein